MDCFSYPIIDVEATSLRLKALREQRNISVRELQGLFAFEYPQAIYNWENPKDKTLPRLDNLVVLARLYKVPMDELVVIRIERNEYLSVHEPSPPYTVSEETLAFIKANASSDLIRAIGMYFGFELAAYPSP